MSDITLEMGDDAIRAIVHPAPNRRLGWFFGDGAKRARYIWFVQNPNGAWEYAGRCHVSELGDIKRAHSAAQFNHVSLQQGYTLIDSWALKNGGGNGLAK